MSAIQGLMSSLWRLLRFTFKGVLSVAALAVVAFLALVLINAFDEDLSADAQALLAPPQMGKIEDGNGFVAFLGIVAPKDQDQMAWGRKAAEAYAAQAQPGFRSSPTWEEATRNHLVLKDGKQSVAWCRSLIQVRACLAEAKRDATSVTRWLEEDDNPLVLARYRKARESSSFRDVYRGSGVFTKIPHYASLSRGSALAYADIARLASSGNMESAIVELEREVAFHRKLAMHGESVISVMLGNNLLSRDLLTISELVRDDKAGIAPFRARLSALARPQASAASLAPGFRLEAHSWVHFALKIREILRDNREWMLLDGMSLNFSPISNWGLSLLALPNQSANLVAAMTKIDASLVGVPAHQFDARSREVAASKAALSARPWYSKLRNLVGKQNFEDGADLSGYVERMHDLRALEIMTSLQIALAERDISDPAAIANFISSEDAKAYANPYTGKPFAFDPGTRLLSFEARATKYGFGKELKARYGKSGIRL